MILTVVPTVMPERLQQTLDDRLGEVLSWQPLTVQGTSHVLYSAEDQQGKRWVARVQAYSQAAPAVDPMRERQILEALSDFPWRVDVALNQPETGLLLQRWAGETLSRESINGEKLTEIIHAVSALHQRIDYPRLDYSEMFTAYRAAFSQCSRGYLQLVKEAESLLKSLPEIGESLVHHDLHTGNLCWGEQLALIDWEYAGVGNPWLDYATLARDLDLGWQDLSRFPRLKPLSRSVLESGLSLAIEYVDRLEQIWLHYRSITADVQGQSLITKEYECQC